MSWRNVFDASKLGINRKYSECRLVADSVNYKHLAFNGFVYSISDLNMQNPLCKTDDLL